jgi:prepilin-type N-terminal cleavage/methylation domain-containing protein
MSSTAGSCRRNAFTLIELMVVVAVIGVLVTMVTPTFMRVSYLTKSTRCGGLHSQIIKGCVNYAMAYERWYPGRFKEINPADTNTELETEDEPFMWTSKDGAHDMHTTAESFFGAPDGLWCSLSTLGREWPDKPAAVDIYQGSINVFAGWRIGSSSFVNDAHDNLDQVPERYGNHSPELPLCGDYLADHTLGGRGWVTPHRPGQDPEVMEDDPDRPVEEIPFGYSDGKVRMVDPSLEADAIEPLYTTNGEGIKYWPKQVEIPVGP